MRRSKHGELRVRRNYWHNTACLVSDRRRIQQPYFKMLDKTPSLSSLLQTAARLGVVFHYHHLFMFCFTTCAIAASGRSGYVDGYANTDRCWCPCTRSLVSLGQRLFKRRGAAHELAHHELDRQWRRNTGVSVGGNVGGLLRACVGWRVDAPAFPPINQCCTRGFRVLVERQGGSADQHDDRNWKPRQCVPYREVSIAGSYVVSRACCSAFPCGV